MITGSRGLRTTLVRTLRMSLGGIVLAAGCGPTRTAPPQPGGQGSWRIVAIDPAPGQVAPPAAGGLIPEVAVRLAGQAGYARATIAVERTEANAPARTAVYDILFPIQQEVRFVASVAAAGGSARAPRVQIRAESGSEVSTSFVEPGVPFLAPGARVTLESLSGPGQPVGPGQEVELARWVVQTGAEVARVTVRVLLSRQPTGPRLKPEARPPT